MEKYIAVLDVGTSKMLALAVSMENRSNIIASAQVESGDAMKRGLIADETEFKTKITELLKNFQEALPSPLSKIYIGLGGQGLHSEIRTSIMPNDGEEITQRALSAMDEDFYSQSAEWSVELLDMYAAAQEYYLDGELEEEPVGKIAQRIEGRYFCIVGHQQKTKTILENILYQMRIEIVDYFISPLATAASALSIQDKLSGCALVEMGASLTYLSIYNDSKLCYLQTLPLGGDAITNDLCVLNADTTKENAEKKKITEGKAIAEDDDKKTAQWIEARMIEIVSNLTTFIQQSGYANQLEAGIVWTGGASQLPQIDRLWATQSNIKHRFISNQPEKSCAWGMAKMGKIVCGNEQQNSETIDETPPVDDETEQKSGLRNKLTEWFFNNKSEKEPDSKGTNEPKDVENPKISKKSGHKKKQNTGMKDLFSGFAEKILND